MFSNNVTRLLDSKKIPYTIFELPQEKLGAVETAQRLGIDKQVVFKTIVTRKESNRKFCLAVIPGDADVDLKLLAKLVNEKKISLTTQAEAEKATGLLAGGISPLALLNRGFQVVVDTSAESLEWIHISGGQRGINIRLSPVDLIKLVNASTGLISTHIDSDE